MVTIDEAVSQRSMGEVTQSVRTVGDPYTFTVSLDMGELNPSVRPPVAFSTAGNAFRIVSGKPPGSEGPWTTGLSFSLNFGPRTKMVAGDRPPGHMVTVRPEDPNPEPGAWPFVEEEFDYVSD